MKIIKKLLLVTLIALLFITLSGLYVNAGYEENNVKQLKDSIISVEQYFAKGTLDSNEILILGIGDLDCFEISKLQDELKNGGTVWMEFNSYEELKTSVYILNPNMILDFSKFPKEFEDGGRIELTINENDAIEIGECLASFGNNDNLLRIYNSFLNSSCEDDSNDINNATSSNIVRSAIQGNFDLACYWANSTNLNGVYTSATTNSTKITGLYKGEIFQLLNPTEIESSYVKPDGEIITDYMIQVQVCNSSSTLTGGYLQTAQRHTYGDESIIWQHVYYPGPDYLANVVWWAHDYNDQNSQSSSYFFSKGNGTVGIKLRNVTTIYDSSGNQVGVLTPGMVIWIRTSNRSKCGYSHPDYMSIYGYSLTGSSNIVTFASTTFIGANLITNTPVNYKIYTRWW